MWQPLDDDARTEVMQVPGGALYRTSWRMSHGIGAAVQDCCGVVFVPGADESASPTVVAPVTDEPAIEPMTEEAKHEEAVAA